MAPEHGTPDGTNLRTSGGLIRSVSANLYKRGRMIITALGLGECMFMYGSPDCGGVRSWFVWRVVDVIVVMHNASHELRAPTRRLHGFVGWKPARVSPHECRNSYIHVS